MPLQGTAIAMEYLRKIQEMMDADENDPAIGELIEQYEIKYADERDDFHLEFIGLRETAFAYACRKGHCAYIEQHIPEIDLNGDSGEHCPYIRVACADAMKILLRYGAIMNSADCFSCRFAGWYYGSVDSDIVSFSPTFAEEAFDRMLQKLCMSREEALCLLSEEETDRAGVYHSFREDCASIGAEALDGALVFGNYDENGAPDICEILERLGYEVNYNTGCSLENSGMYFVK